MAMEAVENHVGLRLWCLFPFWTAMSRHHHPLPAAAAAVAALCTALADTWLVMRGITTF
jgi:hypothetical protein